MIQRKQTIYLLLALICNLLLLYFPLFNLKTTTAGIVVKLTLGATGIEGAGQEKYYPLFVLYIIMSLMTAMGIALYKNRKRQLLVSRINLIFHILVMVGLFTFYYVGKGIAIDRLKEKGYNNVEIGTDIGFYLCLAAIPFILLAIRGIRGDEELLKSIDRIR